MLVLLLCILCNVLLVVIFKALSSYRIDNQWTIIFNYATCLIVGSLFIGKFIIPPDILSKPWFYHALLLGFFFITGFNILGLAYQKAGVALTIIIVKMSLIMSVIMACGFYGESLNFLKIVGILSALAAIVMVNLPGKKSEEHLLEVPKSYLIYPILAFILSGLIECLLFYVQVNHIVVDDQIEFVAISFTIAGIFGLIYAIYRSITTRFYPGKRELIAGIILGVPNFLTIYLLLLLLKMGWDGSVAIPLNNIGILILTTIVGLFFYKEKLNFLRGIGIVLAIAAIVFIALGSR